jgi:Transglycosylase SLT domain
MRFLRQAAISVFLFGAATAFATDVAILRNGFEIRHDRRDQRGGVTRMYFHAEPDSSYVDVATEEIVDLQNVDPPVAAASPVAKTTTPPLISELVNAASERHLVDADLIASVIHAESNFNTSARSPKGARGLMQLMPETAMRLGVKDSFQPEANIDAGSRYLRELLLRYDGDVVKALAAYNAGPQRVAQYRGVPPYPETRAYVTRVVRDFNCRKLPANKKVDSKGSAAKCPESRKGSLPGRASTDQSR